MSYGIAIAIVLLLVLVFLGLLLLSVGLIMVVWRARSRTAPPPRAIAPPPRTIPPPVSQRSVPPPAPKVPSSPPKAEAPPLAGNSGLLGFFDDESSFMGPPSGGAPREVEGAKTELFQRGKMAIDWDDDDSDEAEATEIFSAHGAAGDLAEFAFDDDDQSTGRFS